MKEFQITRRNGDVISVQVDDEDYDRVMASGPWFVLQRLHTCYVTRHLKGPDCRVTQYLHRFILGDACIGKVVDHIDGAGWNNQRTNLRACAQAENVRNQQMRGDNSSGLKGTSWHKASQRWRAVIQIDRKQCALGYFDTAEEAHAAYCEAATRLHGEFARF